MSHCAGRCTVNAPSGCAASQDLQCVHVRNTQHSLPVQVEGYTRCDPCLPAPACCNQHIGRTPSETREGGRGGKKKKWDSGNSGGHGGPAAWIYTRNVWSWHTFVWSHGKSSRVARQSCNPLCPSLLFSGLPTWFCRRWEHEKVGGKKWHRKLFNLLCIQKVDDGHNNTPVIFKTVPAAVWLFLCWHRHFFILSIIQV